MFTIPFSTAAAGVGRGEEEADPSLLYCLGVRGWCLWMRSREAGDRPPLMRTGRRPRCDAMAGRHSRKTPAALSDAKQTMSSSVRVAPRAPWMAQGTEHWHHWAPGSCRSLTVHPQPSPGTMCQGAALMAWWDRGLAGEGLKIGRSHGCGCRRRAAESGLGEKQRRTMARHQAPRAAGARGSLQGPAFSPGHLIRTRA